MVGYWVVMLVVQRAEGKVDRWVGHSVELLVGYLVVHWAEMRDEKMAVHLVVDLVGRMVEWWAALWVDSSAGWSVAH